VTWLPAVGSEAYEVHGMFPVARSVLQNVLPRLQRQIAYFRDRCECNVVSLPDLDFGGCLLTEKTRSAPELKKANAIPMTVLGVMAFMDDAP